MGGIIYPLILNIQTNNIDIIAFVKNKKWCEKNHKNYLQTIDGVV